ncbi:MAG: hydroxyethylthiazole kinase [Deltaproteobacteria bacterium]|nr:hydroxyethylthiazole kinase [Deltaproteobacteria bacterium]
MSDQKLTQKETGNWKNVIAANLDKVRTQHPLVHNITNFVVMNSSANILLAQGAMPVMAHAINEVEHMVSLANALVLNIGTLTDEWVEAMIKAGRMANEKSIPVVLDPVGAGATPLRTEKAKEILHDVRITVLRGNASEINALAVSGGITRGVDSIHQADEVIDSALSLVEEYKLIIGISGKTDFVIDGNEVIKINNGSSLMQKVTGTGCGLSATVGAFLGVEGNPLIATASAFGFYNIAGEIAEKHSTGPGSFNVAFLDALAQISDRDLENLKIS